VPDLAPHLCSVVLPGDWDPYPGDEKASLSLLLRPLVQDHSHPLPQLRPKVPDQLRSWIPSF